MNEDEDIEETESGAAAAPAPRENALLLGQEAAEAALLQAYNAGRVPHAWLLTGPRGIGKATLAYRFARFLFAEGGGGGGLFGAAPTSLAVAPEHRAFRQVASGGHPDLLVVERGVDPKRRRQRREIVADDARKVGDFLHKTSAQDGWRVVIVDGADLMNTHAANSLLKILEEPPKRTAMLLASDNPGRLLPTIRSRCRMLPLKTLDPDIIIKLIQLYRQDISETDRASLVTLAEGSIGRALDLAATNGLEIYSHIINFITGIHKVNNMALHDFAESLARPGAEESFDLLAELLPGALARLITAATVPYHDLLPAEASLARGLLGRHGLDQWVEVWEKLTHLFSQAEGLNLDRKQVVLNAFFALEEAAR